MNDWPHMPGVLIFSEKLYGFFKIKYADNYQQPHSREGRYRLLPGSM